LRIPGKKFAASSLRKFNKNLTRGGICVRWTYRAENVARTVVPFGEQSDKLFTDEIVVDGIVRQQADTRPKLRRAAGNGGMAACIGSAE
jgi:hypothetical protein